MSRRIALAAMRYLPWALGSLAWSALACGAAPPPVVAYLDIVAGSTEGGENGLGAYLSIFGKHFGTRPRVYIGGTEVARYLSVGPSRGRSDIQQITVQVGALGNAKRGVPLPVQVMVNGVSSNVDRAFTIQPGDFLFVDNQNGDDNLAKPNDINHPWRFVQTADGEGGALAAAKPGDTLVLRGGRVWEDRGRNNRWFRFRYATGSAPTGVKGAGYLTILGYPGEDVRFRPEPGTYGGIHGIDSKSYPGYSQWIVIAGLVIEGGDSSVRDAPINLQVGSNHWRIVNNELGPWDAGLNARSAGISGNGKDVRILGNHIHDIGGGPLNHCLYIDTGAADVEIAYNHLHDCTGGNLIQTFDNLHQRDLRQIIIHHNLLHDGGRYGLNIADGTGSAEIWDNIVYHTRLASLRLHVDSKPYSRFLIAHNTFDSTLNDGATKINVSYVNNRVLSTTGRLPLDKYPTGSRAIGDDFALNPRPAGRPARVGALETDEKGWSPPD